jgi:uncharacterized protein Yka (UPF0111/DUF47 family)
MVAIHEKNWIEAEKIRRTIGHKEGEADILKKKLKNKFLGGNNLT